MFIAIWDLVGLLITAFGFGGTVTMIATGWISEDILCTVPPIVWCIGWQILVWRVLHNKCTLLD